MISRPTHWLKRDKLLPDPTKVPVTINSIPSRASSQLGPLYEKHSSSPVGTSDARPGTACCYECCQTVLYAWWRGSDNLLVTMLSSVLVWNGTWGDWRTCNQRVVYVLFLAILAKTWNIISSAVGMKHSKALYNTVRQGGLNQTGQLWVQNCTALICTTRLSSHDSLRAQESVKTERSRNMS